MEDRLDDERRGRPGHRGLTAVLVVVAAAFMGLTAGVTSGPSPASGAAAWLAAERPAGVVLTVDGWASTLDSGGAFTVETAADGEIVTIAALADPGAVVVPVGDPSVDELGSTGRWTVYFRDRSAVVLVHDGALPVNGAT